MKKILMILGAGLACLSACTNNTEVQEQTPDLQPQIDRLKQHFGDLRQQNDNLRQQIDVADLQQQVGDLKQQIKDTNAQVQAQVDKVIAAEKQAEKTAAQVPMPVWRVNVLLVDEFGRVPHCFKGVRVSDITQNGRLTHFVFDGKPIDWNQKVVFSYSYTDNQPPITGAIVWTPRFAGEACKVVNVPPCNVYQDADGTIRYDDGAGRYPCAPKGAGYITAQSILPTQQ